MKKLSFVVAGMMMSILAYGQGTVNFSTRVIPDIDIKIFDIDGVTPLAGTGFTAQLFGGVAGITDANSLTPLTPTTVFRTGAAAGYVVPAGAVAVTGVGENGVATLQLRAWNNMGGTITSYAQA